MLPVVVTTVEVVVVVVVSTGDAVETVGVGSLVGNRVGPLVGEAVVGGLGGLGGRGVSQSPAIVIWTSAQFQN